MLEPLEQFICDKCNGVIQSKEEGLLEYLGVVAPCEDRDFKIVHRPSFSPLPGSGCHHHPRSDLGKQELAMTVDLDGLGEVDDPDSQIAYFYARRLRFLPPGQGALAKPSEWDEIMRRLTLPHYEEARLFLEQAIADGFLDSQTALYCPPPMLYHIAHEYSNF